MAIKCNGCIHRNLSGYAGYCDYLKNTGHCKIVTIEHCFHDLTKMICPLGERERKGGRGDGEGEGACGDDG